MKENSPRVEREEEHLRQQGQNVWKLAAKKGHLQDTGRGSGWAIVLSLRLEMFFLMLFIDF